jgi:polyhydroxyalkanoate synthesis regulator phasin
MADNKGNFMADNYSKEIVGLWKSTMENSLQSMSLLQNQSEKVTKMMMEQGMHAQEEGKKFFDQWLESVKKSQQDFQVQLQSQFEKLEQFLGK